VQDLVRVGISDATEELGVGERALERVPIRFQSRGKVFEPGLEDLEPARSMAASAASPRPDGSRHAACPRLREQQRCVVELEHGERYAPRGFRATCQPAQPPGDHKVQHEEQPAFELEDDALADSAKAQDLLPSADAMGGFTLRRTKDSGAASA